MKSIKQITGTTTYYPNKGKETVKLCYFKPYSCNANVCIDIKANATATTEYFNSYTFDKGAKFTIRHQLDSGSAPAYPAANDRLVIRYSY